MTGLYWDLVTSRATRVEGGGEDPSRGRVRLGDIDQLLVSGRVAAGLEGALTARSGPSGAALDVRLDAHGVKTVLVNLADLDFPRLEWTGDNGVFVIAERPVT